MGEFIQVQENFASKLNIVSDLIEDIENLADEMNMTETVENNNSTNDPNATIATQMEESNLNVTDVIENMPGESNTTITSNFEESKLNGTDNVEANMTESIMMKAMKDIPENPDNQTCQHPKFGDVDCNTIPDKIEKEANDRSDNSDSIQFIQVQPEEEAMEKSQQNAPKANVASFLTRFIKFF